MKITFIASCFAFLTATALHAQSVDEPRWRQILDQVAVNVDGGIAEPFFTTKKNLSTAYTVQGGAGFNFSPHFTLMCEIEYSRFRITDSALTSLGTPQAYPGGHLHNDSVTAQPIWHFRTKGVWDVYATGGGGAFERTQNLVRPTVATATGENPFFGFNSPGYPASETALNYSVKKPGVDGGVGASIKIKWNIKMYAEVRYNHIFGGALGRMDYMPITLGFRW